MKRTNLPRKPGQHLRKRAGRIAKGKPEAVQPDLAPPQAAEQSAPPPEPRELAERTTPTAVVPAAGDAEPIVAVELADAPASGTTLMAAIDLGVSLWALAEPETLMPVAATDSAAGAQAPSAGLPSAGSGAAVGTAEVAAGAAAMSSSAIGILGALAALGLAAAAGGGGGSGGTAGGTATTAGTNNTPGSTNLTGGKMLDGYIAGARIYEGTNGNGVVDEGVDKLVGHTDANGEIVFDAVATGEKGLLGVGGVDRSTGLAFTGLLKAPAG